MKDIVKSLKNIIEIEKLSGIEGVYSEKKLKASNETLEEIALTIEKCHK